MGRAPEVGLFAQVVKNLFFSNMVMWHIKSTGITIRTECKNFLSSKGQTMDLGVRSKVKYH